MIQPIPLDSVPSTPDTPKPPSRQATVNSYESNNSNKKIRVREQNRNLSIRSRKSAKSYQSHRRENRLPWVLAPLARRVLQKTQSLVSIKMPPSNPLSEEEIDKKLGEIYDIARTDTSRPKTLQPFWDQYCDWLKFGKDHEDSQSQIEYWTAKDGFLDLNKLLKESKRAPISRTKFQSHMKLPDRVRYLSTLSNNLLNTKLGILTYFQVIFLLLQYTLNIVFISQQLNDVINFNADSLQESVSKGINLPKTREEYIKSSIGIGYLLEFSFLATLIFTTILQLITFITTTSIMNKGIVFLNFIVNIQKTAEFSLFKFIHLLNPSSYIMKFHEPPLLDFISNAVKFTLRKPTYEPKVVLIYKLFYTFIVKPIFSLLGLMALYIKLLQVSTSLEWLNRLNYDTSVFVESWNNYNYILNFLGLANNIAGLYGLQPHEERQAFFVNHKIFEFDFVYSLLEHFQENQFYKGYWNLTLYAVGIDYKDLIEIFWEEVYGPDTVESIEMIFVTDPVEIISTES
ncbi:9304_t:CDS:1 [Funneliformis mosseae]|uniref:9304_t:CDS:1 n=1 Tax=Funneliformis mosseae TaxID=27381 RepID=A0A9N9FBP9_FUNMO|nr:9304_t:CDS:1 [Funneliformis mosseae]